MFDGHSIWTMAAHVLSTNFADLSRRAATFVGKILKRAKPAKLPVDQPPKFGSVINLKIATQIR